MYERSKPKVRQRTGIPSQPLPLRAENVSLADAETDRGAGAEETVSAGQEQTLELEGVYIISVAARILDVHPQTLRKYERLGLISPGRTLGMLRLYSREDIRRVRLIRHLGNMGLNLAGVEFALASVENLLDLEQRLLSLAEDDHSKAAIEQEIGRVFQSLNLPVHD
jgi:MerR family transcriptional regulator/heat shock protein HspR